MTGSPTRILVIGRSGQVATALRLAGEAREDVALTALGRPQLDLTGPTDTLHDTIAAAAPGIIINAAAYTGVDQMEDDPAGACEINAEAPCRLAEIASDLAIPLLHMSTDCVFDGEKPGVYTETDPPRPISVYGRSKLAGERGVAERLERHLIVRVSWVFSPYAGNFVRTMLGLAQTRDTVTVVSDQYGCPTHADDLAAGLLEMALQSLRPGFADWGVYHLAGSGQTDRARQAEAIFADSAELGGPVAEVQPIATRDYPTPARRPLNARLSSRKAGDVFALTLPDWRQRTSDCVAALLRRPALSKPLQKKMRP